MIKEKILNILCKIFGTHRVNNWIAGQRAKNPFWWFR